MPGGLNHISKGSMTIILYFLKNEHTLHKTGTPMGIYVADIGLGEQRSLCRRLRWRRLTAEIQNHCKRWYHEWFTENAPANSNRDHVPTMSDGDVFSHIPVGVHIRSIGVVPFPMSDLQCRSKILAACFADGNGRFNPFTFLYPRCADTLYRSSSRSRQCCHQLDNQNRTVM